MTANLNRGRVLIVDDVSANITVLGGALAAEHDVQFALSGEQALAMIAADPPELVLLDILMPGMDGLETLRRIKAMPEAKWVEVVLITGDVRTETQVQGLQLGAIDFLVKPVELPALCARTRNLIERARLQREQERLISSLEAANQEVSRLLQFNELLLSAAGEGIFGVDTEGRCTFINPAALAMIGFEKDDVIGRNTHLLFHHHHAEGSAYLAEDCPTLLTLADGQRREADDVFVRRDGSLLPIHMTVTAMTLGERRVGAEVVFQDIAVRQRLDRELLRLATTDTLTDVANRYRFFQIAEAEMARVRRYGSPAGLLMVDLDHFKRVNDAYGHAAGDAVLCSFAALVRERLRKVDVIGRLGGEEFAVLLPDTAIDGAVLFAKGLCELAAAAEVVTKNGNVHYSVSIGVAEITPADTDVDAVLARADAGLYAAKEGGRNRVAVVAGPEAQALPILAIAEPLARLDGDREIFMMGVAPLPKQIDADRASIAAALAANDCAALRKAAHRLKGALGLVGAQRALATCEALEAAAKREDALACAAAQGELEHDLDALLPELSALLLASEN